MYVGKKIKEFREAENLTQYEFADILGVSQPYYSAIEGSKKPITKKLLKKMDEKWGIKKSFFESEVSKNLGDEIGGVSGGVLENEPIFIDKNNIKNAHYRSKAYAFQNRIAKEIADSNPEINQLRDLLFKVSEVGEFAENLSRSAHKTAMNQTLRPEQYFENGRFDEVKFKDDYLNSYRKLLFIKPALEKFVDASEKLFEFIGKNDTDDLIYWEIPSGWIDEKVRVIAPQV